MTNSVATWLAALGLGEYAQPFADQGIEFDLLRELTDADLIACGVAKLGHRKRLLKAVAALPPGARAAHDDIPESSLASKTEAERRQLTVMFCDLMGATTLSTQEDPEDLRRILASYHDVVTTAVAPYDGYVAQLLGDGVLVLFGYPRAHEEETIRAVRAAIAVMQALAAREFGPHLQLQARIGIATGLVVIGEIGVGTPAAETGVAGETPNLAARLQAEAPAMGIVISDETRRLIGETFELESLGALMLKGFARPQPGWRVVGERVATTRFEALRALTATRLVGRDPELALLTERWELARSGEAELVLLCAEAGMGKSRIAQALRERVEHDGGAVLALQCSPNHAGSAMHPVLRWIEMSAGLVDEDDGPSRLSKVEQAAGVLGVDLLDSDRQWITALLSPAELATDLARLPPAELQRAIHAALAAIMTRLSRMRPLLLLVEDAHWIDSVTDDLLARVTQYPRDASVLTLVTARPSYQPDWTNRSSATRLTLNRLGRRACEQIVAEVAAKPLPHSVLGQILAKTDGVPLFVEEFTRTVLRSGLLAEGDHDWRLVGPLHRLLVPATLHDSLMARLDQLALAREVAQVGAAMGREFDAQVVARALGVDVHRLQAPLAELGQAGLVIPCSDRPVDGHVYVFKHALIRDVAYESMLRTVRASTHGRIARAMLIVRPDTADSAPDLLAHHYQEAGEDDLAWPLWVKAAQTAASKPFAFEQALDLCEKALRLLRRAQPVLPSRTCELLLLKDSVLGRLGRWAEQRSTLDEALATAEALGQPELVVSVLLRRASACAYLGDIAQARLDGVRALETCRERRDRPGEAQALRELGFLHWRADDHGAALQYAREALTVHRSLGDVAGEATALHNLAEIHRNLGSPKQSLEWYGQALQLHWAVGDHEGEILTLFGVANALRQAGDTPASNRKYQEALALSERHGQLTMQSRALQALAIDARTQGLLAEALALIRRAIDIDRSISYAYALSHDLVELGSIHLLRGETDAARSAIQEARTWFALTDETQEVIAAGRWLDELDAGGTPTLAFPDRPHWVKTHVPLPEGKVYCEFESPLAMKRSTS